MHSKVFFDVKLIKAVQLNVTSNIFNINNYDIIAQVQIMIVDCSYDLFNSFYYIL